MSTQRGNGSRTRAQKHKNKHAFKNDLHDKTPQQKRLNTLHVSEVCMHCKGVIEWKIKYKKYKPLSQPKTCTRCQQRNIRKAYHVLCRGCALETKVCAKCLKSAEEVEIEPPEPTPEEQLRLKVEMERLIKSFPERKRRAFLRYMDKGKKNATEEETQNGEKEAEDNVIETNIRKRVPHTRDELLERIEKLKLAGENSDDDYDFDTDDEDFDDDDSLEEESDVSN